MFKKIAVAIITPTHTKKSFDMGLVLAKKLDSDLSVIECVYKNPPKFYENGKPTQLAQDILKGKKHRVKIIKQRFGNGREDFDIAKS